MPGKHRIVSCGSLKKNVHLSQELLIEVIYTCCSQDMKGSKLLAEEENGAVPSVQWPAFSVWFFFSNNYAVIQELWMFKSKEEMKCLLTVYKTMMFYNKRR